MHNSPKDLRSRIFRAISYILVAIFVVVGTYYLANYAQGILINPTTGDTTQNGLVIIQSKPVNAAVTLNDQTLNDQTPTRQILPVGNYTVSLNADGYKTWSKDFTVVGSDINWLDYPLLVPQKINTTQEAVFSKKPVLAISNNRRMILAGTSSELRIFNIANKKTTETEIKLPEELVASLGRKPVLRKLQFASNDRYILAKYQSGKKSYFVRIDHDQPDQSINLNDIFELKLKKVEFNEAGNFNDFYGQDNKNLYTLETDSQKVQKITAAIPAFHSFKDYLFTVSSDPDNKTKSIISYRKDDSDFVAIDEVDTSSKYIIDVQQFKDRINLVVATDKKTYLYKNIRSGKTKPITIKTRTQQAIFSSNGRFLAISNGRQVQTFDLEFKHKFKFDISRKTTKFRWTDNFRLSLVADSNTSLVDFDGNNNQAITHANSIFVPISNQNNESFISVSKDKNRYVLERSRLRVE